MTIKPWRCDFLWVGWVASDHVRRVQHVLYRVYYYCSQDRQREEEEVASNGGVLNGVYGVLQGL